MFNLDNYETVEDRLIKFWTDHPNGRIHTTMVHYDDTKVVFRAEIYFDRDKDQHPIATGYAEEIRGASPVNKTSHVENGETSAIGRGLANCGYATKGARPSREEMSKVVRQNNPVSQARQFVDNSRQDREEMVMSAFPESQVVKPKGPIMIKNPSEPASKPQLGKISALLYELGIEREEKLEFVSNVIERQLAKMEDLTKGEASKVIEHLK